MDFVSEIILGRTDEIFVQRDGLFELADQNVLLDVMGRETVVVI
jgi:hypothetical protein